MKTLTTATLITSFALILSGCAGTKSMDTMESDMDSMETSSYMKMNSDKGSRDGGATKERGHLYSYSS